MEARVMPSRKDVEEILSLTPLQEGMLFHYLKSPDDNLYFEQLCLNLSGEIDSGHFRRAWEMVTDTNEMLRTVFRWKKLKRPVQIVLKSHPIQIRYHDISSSPAAEREQRLKEIKVRDREATFDLQQVAFRVTLCKEAEDRYYIIISNHHILYDGWSNGIILGEFFRAYHAPSAASPATMRKWVKTKFRSFIHWSQQQDPIKQEAFWKSYLAEFETFKPIPLKGGGEKFKAPPRPGCHKIRIGAGLWNRIEGWVKKERVTQAAFFYTAWGILLQRYTNSGDVVFGTTVSGRNADINGIESMVGLFINTVPLRVARLESRDESVNTLTSRVHRDIRDRQPHENTPLVKINEYINWDSHTPLFDTLMVIENYPLSTRFSRNGNGLSVLSFSMYENTNFDLTIGITLMDEMEDIEVEFLYPAEGFGSESIRCLADHYRTVIEEMIAHSHQTVRDIRFLSEEETHRLVEVFNDTAAEYSARETITEWIDRQVGETPDHVAVTGAGEIPGTSPHKYVSITYKDLNRRAGNLAQLLRSRGVQRNTIVGLLVDRSVEMLVAILGILKAGGAYMPIDPDYPRERIRYILADSTVNLLVCTRSVIEENKKIRREEDKRKIEIIYTESFQSIKTPSPVTPAPTPPEPAAADTAYVIYTSGSTGRPKGVLVEHRNLTAYVDAFLREFSITESSIVVQQASYAFDTFSEEVYPALVRGGKLVVPCRDDVRDIYRFAHMISAHSVTVVDCSPLLLERLNQPEMARYLKSVELFISGGDVLRGEYIHRLLDTGEVYNTYGPTETTVCATYYKCIDTAGGGVSIGAPIANYQVYILDRFAGLMPVGVPGELCIGGEGVTRGYLNRPELTAEKFIHALGIHESPTRLYKTGDLARWCPDGNIEFLGRMDFQVNIRGFRIELGEIENQLLTHSQVRETAVLTREDREGDPYVCAYVVCAGGEDATQSISDKLRNHLASRLPGYMLPSFFVRLDNIPLNTSGKPDRKALPAPDRIAGSTNYAPPRNDTESKLVEIWADVLAVEISAIGIDTNFFQAGGHSLKAVTMVAAIHKELDVLVPLAEIFQTPTIRQLTAKIMKTGAREFVAIEPVEKKEYYKLSSAQKRLYLLKQMDGESTGYNMTEVLEVKGAINKDRLEERFMDLIRRHESLRTSFLVIDDHPVQRIHDDVPFRLEYFDAGETRGGPTWPPDPAWLSGKARTFDLSQAPLMRVCLIRFGKEHHLLMVEMHHIISDGVSVEILVRDFMHFREAGPFPPLTIQYRDFSEWQNRQKSSAAFKSQEEFWLKEFEEEPPVLELPLDFVRPPLKGGKGDSLTFHLEPSRAHRLFQLAQAEETTLYMLMLAIYNIFLAKISGQESIVVGTPVAGRRHADLKPVVGMFVNTLPLKNFPNAGKKVKFFLRELKSRTLDAFENQDYPFENLVENVLKNRDTSRNPLFDVVFSLENKEKIETRITDMQLTEYPYRRHTSKFDLTLAVSVEGEDLSVQLTYRTDLFKGETLQRYISGFKRIIDGVLDDPGRPIATLSLLTGKEKQIILHTFNDTDAVFPGNNTLHRLFETQAARTPDRIALSGETLKAVPVQLSYRELNHQVKRLAALLKEYGLKTGTIIGVMLERSTEMIVAILAVLKSGCAYMPIAEDYPGDRVQYMLADSGAVTLISTRKLCEENKKIRIETGDKKLNVIYMESFPAAGPLSSHPVPHVSAAAEKGPGNLAYIIYTSGSTGKPKGVMVEHRSAINLAYQQKRAFSLDETERILQFTTIGFDPSVEQIFIALLSGAALQLISKDRLADTRQFDVFIKRHAITHFHAVPMFLALIRAGEYPGLRRVISGGDVCPPQLARNWSRHCDFFNKYGPTETTITSTQWRAPGNYESGAAPPIGKPVANNRVYILDQRQKLLPVGIFGELYIGGTGITRGYLNRPELTAEKFIYVTGIGNTPILMYRTGDFARWLPDGNIQFAGRRDHQVKIRGFRIETGEIENRLVKHAGVKDAAVIGRQTKNGEKFLCAYIVYNGPSLEDRQWREYLGRDLPDYMIPAVFVEMEKLPLNTSGKVARNKLPAPRVSAAFQQDRPANEIEEKIAGLWEEILELKLENISTSANFFHLGGHSLKATVLASRISKMFNVDFSLNTVFAGPTIKEFARFIQQAKKQHYQGIARVEEKEYFPQAPSQKRIFILEQGENIGAAYHMPVLLEIEGEPDSGKLQEVFLGLLDRHEVFRTSFHMVGGEAVQRIHRQVDFFVEYDKDPGNTSFAAVIDALSRPFDLEQPPLLRAGLVKRETANPLLVIDIHHIVSDGISVAILAEEFIRLYNQETLPPLQYRYKDFATWQSRLQQSGYMESQEKYWLDLFKDGHEVPPLNLSADFPRPGTFDFQGNTLEFSLDPEDTDAFMETGQLVEKGVTLYMNILAVFNVLLYKYTGQEDVVVGGVVAGRRNDELQRIVGMFVNTLPIRNYPTGKKNYLEFLEDVRTQCLSAFENQNVPFNTLVEKMNFQRDPSRNPLFDVFVGVQDFQDSGATQKLEKRIHANDGLLFEVCQWETPVTKFDISLDAKLSGEGIQFSLEYYTRIFKPETIKRLARHLSNTIRSVSRSPGTPLEQLEILSGEEKKQVLFYFNDTAGDYAQFLTLHGIFEDRAAWLPDRAAAAGSSAGRTVTLTYKALNERAGLLAARLRKEGIEAGDIAAVMMPPSVEVMTAIMGILKTGAAYLPISPETPRDRIDYMLLDSGAKFLLTAGEEGLGTITCKRAARGATPAGGEGGGPAGPGEVAYIIYTSGTTGKPKGVMVEHRAFVNRLNWMQKRFAFDRQDVVLQKTSIAFDVSVCEFFRWIPGGGRIFIMENSGRKDLERILQVIETQAVTVCEFLPSLLNLLLDHLTEENIWFKARTLRWVFVGAEAISPVVAEKFNITLKRQYGTRLINAYGPTEATVDVTLFDCSAIDSTNVTSTPIGWPIQNTRIYILGPNGQVQPVGVPGELCIAGDSLARGYLNNPRLTAHKFTHIKHFAGRVDPFAKKFLDGESRLYRTGDLARWLPEGNIEFMGRIDRQVKLRGFRIELGEIEAQLLAHPRVNDAVVICREKEKSQVLCAYIVSQGSREPAPVELKLHLLKQLPVYMVPVYFTLMASLPRTANDKIDTRALPAPAPAASVVNYSPPRTGEEEQMAGIWAGMLGLEQSTIGINDSFFDLGGDSLKVIRVISKMKQAGIHVNVDTIFSHQTIGGISAYLEAVRSAPVTKTIQDLISPGPGSQPTLADQLVPHEIESDLERVLDKNRHLSELLVKNPVLREYPVSPVQLSSLMLSEEKLLSRQNLLTVYRFHRNDGSGRGGERSQMEEVKRIVSQLIHENSLMRSVLVKTGEEEGFSSEYIIREYASFTNLPLPYMDLSGYSSEAKHQLFKIIRRHLTRPVEIMGHLLYRVVVLHWDHHVYKVVFSVNHLIFDGGSSRILPEKMEDIHTRQSSGYQRPDHEESATDYYDYCTFMNRLNYRHIHLEPFIDVPHYKNNVQRITSVFRSSTFVKSGFEVDLSGMKETLKDFYNEIILLTYARTIGQLFHIDPVPISSVSHGRHYRGGNFGDIIGDFHDFIPVFFPARDSVEVGKIFKRFLDFKKYINQSNLNFISYFVAGDNTREDFLNLISPFSFNSLIGLYDDIKEENESRNRRQDENEDGNDDYGLFNQTNSIRPKFFDLVMVRDPNSECIWIDITQNSIFDNRHVSRLFVKHFKRLVRQGNRNTGTFLP
jgi:amino acid adenylation domain-containing protein